jgi:hypothetical protein
MLPTKISLSPSVYSRQMDGALALDEPNHLRHRILRWDRDQHVHVIRQQISFHDPAFLLLGQFPKDLAQESP